MWLHRVWTWLTGQTEPEVRRAPVAEPEPAAPVAAEPEADQVITNPIPEPAGCENQDLRPAADGLPRPPQEPAEEAEKKRLARAESELARQMSRTSEAPDRVEVLFHHHLAEAVNTGRYKLPMLPATAAQVFALSRDTRKGIKDIVPVVEADPSLVKSIIQMANSVFFSSLKGYQTLHEAIVRIGLPQVEQIAMAQAFQSRLFRVAGHEELVAEQGRHAIVTAVAGQAVAVHLGAGPGDAFLAGLFHDAGKLIMLDVVSVTQQKLKLTAPRELIERAFRDFHVRLGEVACRRWSMSEEICQAVCRHHDGAAANQPLDVAVYLGNLLAHSIEEGEEYLARVLPADPVIARASLSGMELASLRAGALKSLEAYAGALGFKDFPARTDQKPSPQPV